MPRPTTADYAPYFHNYVLQVLEDDLYLSLKNQSAALVQFLDSIPASKADYAYAPDKWTVKELLQHMIDTERIFAHRALWFARKSDTPLTGFDENAFAANADVRERTLASLVEEMKIVRQSTSFLFHSFSPEVLNTTGVSSDHSFTVNAMGFITVGHFLHHQKVMKERYGI